MFGKHTFRKSDTHFKVYPVLTFFPAIVHGIGFELISNWEQHVMY